jgi:hypothetical protein
LPNRLAFKGRVALALSLGLVSVPLAAAGDEPIGNLANALCAASDIKAMNEAVGARIADEIMSEEQIAEAFGFATFLGDLGRCANRQAIADSYALFKKDKDQNALDAAFATGRVAAKPEGGGTASAEIYQGSFGSLGTAGDPPSGQ